MDNKSGKSKKGSKDDNHKDSKLEEQVLKTLGDIPADEKLNLLLKKYVEVDKENKRLQSTIKQNERSFDTILKEKENLQREFNKNLLMRNKLEEVCREQQKLIKSVKNESMQKIREEEERRKENQTKFQHSINEINVTLNKNNDENIKLREDNIEMVKRLKYLAEQYQTREKQLEKINEQVQIESQLHDAKLTKLKMESAIEKEILLREKQSALDDLLSCKKMLKELNEREMLLKEQLNLYTSKYDDFQSSLQKSNHIFTTYKSEIDKMAKNTSRLEKESMDWKQKFQRSNITLIELATERKEKDEYVARCTKQSEQLQKLLRALQNERSILYQTLKLNNIEQPTIPILPPEPEPIKVLQPTTSDPQKGKMELMAKNCAELKLTLASLQGQMKEITDKQSKVESNTSVSVNSDESNKKKKNKKPKNKNKGCPTKTTITPTEVTEIETNLNSLSLNNGTEVKEIQPPTEGNLINVETKNVKEVPSGKEIEVHAEIAENENSNASAAEIVETVNVEVAHSAAEDVVPAVVTEVQLETATT